MSDTTTNPAEKPVNDGGGGNAPQQPEPTDGQAAGDTQTTEGGGSD